jgi:predicted PurR-regulated permease PerM
MIPIDSEFVLMYIAYGIFFIFLLWKYFKTKNKVYTFSLGLYLIYTFLMIYIFLDKESFKGGNSLAVIFLGSVLIVIHLFFVFIYEAIKLIKNK